MAKKKNPSVVLKQSDVKRMKDEITKDASPDNQKTRRNYL